MKVLKTIVFVMLLVACLIAVCNNNSEAEVTVYDADGQYLGILLNSDISTYIYIPSLQRRIKLDTGSGDLVNEAYLLFESDNCTGQQYLRESHAYHVVSHLGTYYIGERVAPVSYSFQSRELTSGSCVSYNKTVEAVLSQEFQIDQLPFNLPVALPLSFDVEPTHPGKWKK